MNFAEKLFLKDLRLLCKTVLTFFAGLAILIFLIHGLITVSFNYPLDYGEGTVLNQTLRVMEGQPLYPTDITSPPYLISNYPPVFILLSAALMWFTGPNLLIGRVFVLASTIGTAIIIGLIIKHCHPKHGYLPSFVGAGMFLIIPYVLQWSAYYRIDMLAIFFSITGLYFVIKAPEENYSILLAAVFFLLAAYTRQSFGLAAPVGATIWLWTINRKQAIKLVMMYGISGLVFFGVIHIFSQGGFFFHIIEANVNPFNWHTVENYAQQIYQNMSWLIFLFGIYLLIGWRFTRSYAFLVPYMLVSAAVAVTIGKVGSNVNYLLEICTAFALLTGLVIGRSWELLPISEDLQPDLDFPKDKISQPEPIEPKVRRNMWINLVVLIIISAIISNQLITLSRESLLSPISNHRERIQMGLAYRLIENSVLEASEEGPVLADEYSAMLSVNRIPFYIQPFAISQLAMANRWDQSRFLNAIEAQTFPLILIHHFPGYPVYLDRWTSEMLDAIFSNYVAIHFRANSLSFEPKDFETVNYPEERACPDAPWQTPSEADLGMFWYNRQLLLMGAGHNGQVPVYAVADGMLYQFPEWQASVAIQHDDPFNPGQKIWSFYGGLAPAFTTEESFVLDHFIGLKGVPVRAGDKIGYQGQWLGPTQQTWVHTRFAILPAEKDGQFPEFLKPIDDFTAQLPTIEELANLGFDVPISLTRYTGLAQSNIFGTKVFLPFQCSLEGSE